MCFRFNWYFPALLLLSMSGLSESSNAAQNTKQKLAILIAAPQTKTDGTLEKEMHNDLVVMEQALLERGFQPKEILKLSGALTEVQLLNFLKKAATHLEKWEDGTVFLLYSGHGCHFGTDEKTAKAGLELQRDGEKVAWDTVFKTLNAPKGVQIVLLPDGCYSNLLAGNVPTNVTAVVMKSAPGAGLVCIAQNYNFPVNGTKKGHGVISYYASKTLPAATSVEDWVSKMKTAAALDLADGILKKSAFIPLTVTGQGQHALPGLTKN